MASSINASTTAGVVTTADTSGVLNIQTAGTTAIAIDASQAVSFTNAPTVTGGTANGVAFLNGSKVLTTGSALVFDGTSLTFGSTSQRIIGDMSNATQASRLLAQTSTANTSTSFGVIPNGSSGVSQFAAYGASDPTNTQRMRVGVDSTSAYLISDITGTGSYLPLTFSTNGSERARFNTTGALVFAGGTTTANGIGITFPATQSASSNANTLDDYEEGSCTLVLSDSSGNNATMGGGNAFRYIKIGRMVSVSGTLNWDSVTGVTTSRTRITGLPFAASSVNAMRWPAVNGSSSPGSFNITRSEIAFGLDFNNAFVWGTKVTGNNQDNNLDINSFGTSGTLYAFQITYFTEN